MQATSDQLKPVTTTDKARAYAATTVFGLSSAAVLSSMLLGSNAGLGLKLASFIGCGLATASAIGIQRQHDLTGADYRAGFDALATATRDHVVTESERDQAVERITKIEVLPEAFRSELSKALNDKVSDTSWVNSYRKLSRLIYAKPGTGKTTFLVNEMKEMIDSGLFQRGGRIVICDRDYGKEDNFWGGLPLWDEDTNPQGLVFRYPHQYYEQVMAAYNEMERRADSDALSGKATNWAPYELYLDEFAGIISKIDKDETLTAAGISKPGEQCLDAVKEIIRRGRGYKVKVTIISQGAAVGTLGISVDYKKFFNMLSLNPTQPDDIKDFAVGISEQLLTECDRLRKLGHRVGVVNTPDGAKVVVIPELTMPKFDLSAVQRDPIQSWRDDNIGLIAQCRADGLSLTKAWERLDKPMTRQSSDNPYYQTFKELMQCA